RFSASIRKRTLWSAELAVVSARSAGVDSAPWPRRGPTRLRPDPACDTTNTRSPHTIGDETPAPDRRRFHATFCVLLHRSGSPDSDEIAAPAGPRHPGQLSADSEVAATVASTI